MNALRNWGALNEALRKATEQQCQQLLAAERKGKRRLQFLLRIYGRYNRLRTIRERKAIAKGL